MRGTAEQDLSHWVAPTLAQLGLYRVYSWVVLSFMLLECERLFCRRRRGCNRAVQWHYIDKLSDDTVPNHIFNTTNHQALYIYNRTKIMG